MHDDIFQVCKYRKHSMLTVNHAWFSSYRHLILKTLFLDFLNMAGSDTYLESVVVMNRIKFMLYFNYSYESLFTLEHDLCQCCLYSTLRFSIENTIITILIFKSVYSLF